jgi:N-acetylglutamate synthase/N-acetylornithine aminotransferase
MMANVLMVSVATSAGAQTELQAIIVNSITMNARATPAGMEDSALMNMGLSVACVPKDGRECCVKSTSMNV